MRSILLALGATAAIASPLQAGCTRESLTAVTDAYVEAQTKGTPSFSIVDASTVYTENFQTATIATGILSKALKIDHKRSSLDTTQCATYTELIITDSSHPYVIGTQIWIKNGKAAKIETLITDEGDWLFNAANTLKYASGESWSVIPEAQRDTRAVIQAAGDAYCDLFNDKSVVVPWGTPCQRLEGGAYTGRGSPTDSCNVGVPSGVALTNRRYVIDETVGAVSIFLTFGSNLPDSHEFRVEKGKLRYVHTITVMGSSSGPARPGGGMGGGMRGGGGGGGGGMRPPRA